MSRLDTMTSDLMARLETLAAERARLTRERDAVTAQLRDVVVALVAAGTPELTVARAAGVGRQSVRTWTGKDAGWPKVKR